jgi:ATP synthase subunit 6
MSTFITIFSPLEQFQILPLSSSIFITNQTVILILVLFFIFTFFFSLLSNKDSSLFIIPTRLQLIIEFLFVTILKMVTDNIHGSRAQLFFPLVFSIFFFIVSLNLIGLIPYSFTVTSHCIVTLFLSFSIFIGMNIICVRAHGLKIFSLFLPAGTSVALSLLLVPVELISYIFKPLSLAIRLFCNMMAGHTLLKVFVGFAWSLMACSGAAFFLQYLPIIILVPLLVLEFGVALIQAFVFSLLTCIYLNDAVNLH